MNPTGWKPVGQDRRDACPPAKLGVLGVFTYRDWNCRHALMRYFCGFNLAMTRRGTHPIRVNPILSQRNTTACRATG